MMRREILPNIKRGLSAPVLTQTSDVEGEINGLGQRGPEDPGGRRKEAEPAHTERIRKKTEGNYGGS